MNKNSVVIVSDVQGRDSAIHMHVFVLSELLSHPGCHITLSRVPCSGLFILKVCHLAYYGFAKFCLSFSVTFCPSQ